MNRINLEKSGDLAGVDDLHQQNREHEQTWITFPVENGV